MCASSDKVLFSRSQAVWQDLTCVCPSFDSLLRTNRIHKSNKRGPRVWFVRPHIISHTFKRKNLNRNTMTARGLEQEFISTEVHLGGLLTCSIPHKAFRTLGPRHVQDQASSSCQLPLNIPFVSTFVPLFFINLRVMATSGSSKAITYYESYSGRAWDVSLCSAYRFAL